jgi:hypothetical protein
MIKPDKSLVEVWEMKDAVLKAFKESGSNNFAEYIENSTKAIREKYNIKYHIEKGKEKQLETT